ncbi:MAG: hypothetical protein WC637_16875 [Victivallales bacterium]|jgi:hypothetical protein
MRKTVYDEKRLFYYNLVFIQWEEAQPYLKMLKEYGEHHVLQAMVKKYHDPRMTGGIFHTHTSMGSEDRMVQTETHALTYNIQMEYFHLWGRDRVASYPCFHCGKGRAVDKMKFDSSVDDVICRFCADPVYFDNL